MTSLFQKFTQGSAKKEVTTTTPTHETNSILINPNDASKRSSQKKKTINFSSESPTFIGANNNSASFKDRESAVAADLADLFLSEDGSDNMEPSILTTNGSCLVTNTTTSTSENSSFNNFGMTASDDFLLNSNGNQSKVSHSSSLNSNTSGYVTNSNSNSSESQNITNGVNSGEKRSKIESVNAIIDDLMTLNSNDTHFNGSELTQDIDESNRAYNSEQLETSTNYFEANGIISDSSGGINGNKLGKYLTTPLNAATISTSPMVSQENGMNQIKLCKQGADLNINENNETPNVATRAAMFDSLNEKRPDNNKQLQINQNTSSLVNSGIVFFVSRYLN